MKKRPVSVTIISILFALGGIFGLAFRLSGADLKQPLQSDIIWVCAVNLIAVVCGIYLLRGSDWARWLALLWMASHVVLSFFHAVPEVVIHALLLAALAFFLFRRPANEYFRHAKRDVA